MLCKTDAGLNNTSEKNVKRTDFCGIAKRPWNP